MKSGEIRATGVNQASLTLHEAHLLCKGNFPVGDSLGPLQLPQGIQQSSALQATHQDLE